MDNAIDKFNESFRNNVHFVVLNNPALVPVVQWKLYHYILALNYLGVKSTGLKGNVSRIKIAFCALYA
jgi:hypothetical protein